jgi:peptide deformylase
MAIRQILVAPNPLLRKKAEVVQNIDASIVKLAEDMVETLEAAGGVGLAAPQIGVSKRVIVIWVPDEDPIVLVNPKVAKHFGERYVTEGCLSVPQMQGKVKRSREVIVKAVDPAGSPVRIDATGLKAQALEHEINHLDGILYTDLIVPGSLTKTQITESFEDVIDDVWQSKHVS